MIQVQRHNHHFFQTGPMSGHNCWVPPQMQLPAPPDVVPASSSSCPWFRPVDLGNLPAQVEPRLSSLKPEQQSFLDELESDSNRRQEVSQRLQQLGYHKLDNVIRLPGDEGSLWTNDSGVRISVDGDGNLKKLPSLLSIAGVVKASG